jgi:hypothetical protein
MATQPVCYLTTTGRRTGRPHRIEIWFIEDDGAVYLFSGGGEASDWVYSARIIDADDDLRRRMDERYYRTPADQQLTDWAARSTVVELGPQD